MAWGGEIALWALLSTAAICDLRFNKIPNRLTLPALALGLAIQWLTSGIEGLARGGLAAGAAFLLFFPLYMFFRTFGAGDVKLLMAAGSFLETTSIVRVGIISVLVGAAVGLVMLIASHGLKTAFSQLRGHLSLTAPKIASTRIPFAPAVFCAFVLCKIGGMLAWF